ncbi:MAG: thiamine diphosphokinase [Clostridiales bacterium]|nr:thiamine diphosphokinase [Clostridiales bacterium]
MRAVIICGGYVGEYIKDYIRTDDFIICADSGYDRAAKYDIEPDIIIGDMDSVNIDTSDKNRIVYPTHKDCTDGELTVIYALEHGFSEVILFGMIGSRMDHTLANISLLKQLKNIDAVIIDDHNEIRFTDGKITLSGNVGDTVSFIPFIGDCEGVTTEGLEYELLNDTVKSGTSLGVSNVMTEKQCSFFIKKGEAFIIRSKD